MVATSDFLAFAIASGANVESQAAYAADASLGPGFAAGTASSAKVNKVLRQSSFVAAAVANLMLEELAINISDDGNLTEFTTNLAAAIQSLFVIPNNSIANAKLVQMAAMTLKGNLSTGLATPGDISVAGLAAALGFSSGSTPNGIWEKGPSGIITQRGFVSGSFTEGAQAITLPTPFPNLFMGLTANTVNLSPTNTSDYWVQLQTSPGASGPISSVNVYIDSGTGGTPIQGFSWNAWGY